MYAIVRTGGKQYTVRVGDTLRVEKLPRELGAEFLLDEVLLVGGNQIHVGEPTVKDAKVTVIVTRQAKAPKVIVFKKRRRQGYRRLHGHRQLYTELFVKTIQSPTGEISEAESIKPVIDPAKKAERLANINSRDMALPKKAKKKVAATKKAVIKANTKKAGDRKASAAK